MATWYVDEGLDKLADEWRAAHPGATIYFIGDDNHSKNPDITQHAPDRGGSKPGDDKGEVDGGDFMPGKGVTRAHLNDLFYGLHRSRDNRLLTVIYEDMIFSSVVAPWKIREYKGTYHGHVHVSVNDNYNNDRSDWKWEKLVERTLEYKEIPGKFPELQLGDEDQPGKTQHIRRIQSIANGLFGEELDIDGVYGAKTKRFVQRMMKDDPARTTANGSKFGVPEMKRLFGIW